MLWVIHCVAATRWPRRAIMAFSARAQGSLGTHAGRGALRRHPMPSEPRPPPSSAPYQRQTHRCRQHTPMPQPELQRSSLPGEVGTVGVCTQACGLLAGSCHAAATACLHIPLGGCSKHPSTEVPRSGHPGTGLAISKSRPTQVSTRPGKACAALLRYTVPMLGSVLLARKRQASSSA